MERAGQGIADGGKERVVVRGAWQWGKGVAARDGVVVGDGEAQVDVGNVKAAEQVVVEGAGTGAEVSAGGRRVGVGVGGGGCKGGDVDVGVIAAAAAAAAVVVDAADVMIVVVVVVVVVVVIIIITGKIVVWCYSAI